MEKVFIVSEDTKLCSFLENAPKYGHYMDKIEFVHVTSVTNIVERNSCVIIDKENYELDALRLFAKKMYAIICTDSGSLEIDIEEDNKVLVVNKPYSVEQIYAALKTLLEYKEMENEADKTRDNEVDVRHAAETDYLTGLPNRRGMYEYFSWGLKTETVHCMFMDIDNFKKVNDTYGHKMGDKLLVRVSHMVKEKIGDAFLARLSGDEFAVIIDGNVSKDNVIKIVDSIMGAVDEVQLNVDVSSIISFSIGVMFDQSSKDDLDDILLKCDVAMYQAKKGGKGRYIIYNDIAEQVEYKMSVDRDKYTALSAGHFKIYMQPRLNMSTLGIESVEAGIYWEHPKDGLRKPEDFIELLEEDGFVVELEKHMFEELCRVMMSWNNTPLEQLPVYFRISKKHLYRKNFVKDMNVKVAKYGLKPQRFCLGLTDIEMHPKVTETIRALEAAGYEVSCVKNVSSDRAALLNINDTLAGEWVIQNSKDNSFSNSHTSFVVARSIVSLAEELNIHIVCRNIAEKKDMESLIRWGCDVAVGGSYSEAMKPDEFCTYALPNIVARNNTYIYEFDGNLADQNGENAGQFFGDEIGYVYDEELKKQVVNFPGEARAVLENTIELPTQLLDSKSYTISLSFRGEDFKLWNSVFYAEFSNGFSTIMPYAWDGIIMFRVKDTLFEDEWHDAIGRKVEEKKWYYVTASYNSKKRESRLYVNGKLVAIAENVHTVEKPFRIVVGADLWQGNFHGRVGNVVIHDYVITREEAEKEYEKYVGYAFDEQE